MAMWGAICKMEYNFKANDLLTHVKPIYAYQMLAKGFHSQVQQPPCVETHPRNPMAA